MTLLQITTFVFLIAICSCKNSGTPKTNENTNPSIDSVNDSLKGNSNIQKLPGDSLRDGVPSITEKQIDPYAHIPRFTVDGFPVTDEMFKGVDYSRKSGDIQSGEGAWFSNDTLKQTLVFILYTDDHRLHTYLFLNSDIPNGIIDDMELQSADDLASFKQKQKYFRGFLKQTKKIEQAYFKTDKGFKLGDSKARALKVYGRPDKISNDHGVEKYEWDFIGDILYDGKTRLRGKPLAKDNYGHQAILFFRNNKLIGIIFHNDIP